MSLSPQAPTDRPVDELHSRAGGIGRERVSDIQCARILAGLVEVVAEHGAANVTVAHIVARSGVSRRTFYELFVDRDDCFLAAFDDAIRRIATVVIPAYEEPPRWREKMRAGLIALLELLEYERGAGHLVIVDALGAGAEALERRRRVLAQVIDAVDQGGAEARQGDDPPPMAAEGVVGGVLAVLHSRLLEGMSASLLELARPLMSMIVLPYLGAAAARKELARPIPEHSIKPPAVSTDPLRDLEMRLTYRTVRVLMAVGENPGSSNRTVGVASGMQDQGQISKLLSRLRRLGLIQNTGVGPTKGAPNAWTLTPKGTQIEQALGRQHAGQPAH
jgi:AcrR family transcriptional regulator